MTRMRFGILLAGAFVMLALVTGCTDKAKPAPTPTTVAKPTNADACAIAEQYVGQYIRAATARFQPCEQQDITPNSDGKTWNIAGWVDADNGKGAFLRHPFTVDMTYLGAKQWRQDSVHVFGQ